MFRNIILPANILAKTVIGAGIFSLPFVFQTGGFLTALFYLAVFAAIFIFIYCVFADLVVRTPGDHRFAGLCKYYFGKTGMMAGILMGILQLFFVLTIYLILIADFSKMFFGDSATPLLIFWIIGSAMIFLDIKRIASVEFFISSGMAVIVSLIFILGLKNISDINLGVFRPFEFSVAGPVIFALFGALMVPEVVSYFRESKIPLSFLKKALVWGQIIPAAIYILFVVGVLGLSGIATEDAIGGLVGKISPILFYLIGILAFSTILGSYMIVGVNVRKTLKNDINLKDGLAKILAICAPIALYLLGFRDFIGMVAFVGAIFLPLECILILLMWNKANKQLTMPPVLISSFSRMFVPVILLIFVIILLGNIL
ncbi:MAG: aromatic amino acid transport family protein [Candidatus Pacebacteria bacterium]|nr:aromatic amino acid transport family protein [Candidatus Paceibacterota bacterium]